MVAVANSPVSATARVRVIVKGSITDLLHECVRRKLGLVSNIRTDKGLSRATLQGYQEVLEKQINEWMGENIIAPFPSGTLLHFVWLE